MTKMTPRLPGLLMNLVLTMIMGLGFSEAAQAQATGFTNTERAMHYLATLWPGDFDNQEQASGEVDPTNPRFHAVVHAVEVAGHNGPAFYTEEHLNAKVDQVHQRWVLTASVDETEQAIRLKVHTWSADHAISAPYSVSKPVASISQEQLRYLPGCDLLVRLEGTRFEGQTTPGSCNDGGSGFLNREISITRQDYQVRDLRTDGRGNLLPGVVAYSRRELTRARWFACMVDVPKTNPDFPNHTLHYIKLHDQGGAFSFDHPNGETMTLIMRNTWALPMQRTTFFIGLIGPDGKTITYAWGEPGADRIGVNDRTTRIQCDLNTPENVRLQQELRAES